MALLHVNAYKCAKFQLPSSISFRDKEGVPKFNVGATSPLLYPVSWNFYVCSKYLARSNSAPNFSIVSVWIVQLCEYVFPIGFPLYVPKMGFLGVLRVKMWNYCLLTPSIGTTLRECASVDVSRDKIGSTAWALGAWKDFAYKERNKKKLSRNFGYMGRRNPWGDLDQMWFVGRYGGHNHVCNIWWLSVKGCGCGERGNFAFSHWLHASPLQHWSHYRVIVW